jgi:hypothetical protein
MSARRVQGRNSSEGAVSAPVLQEERLMRTLSLAARTLGCAATCAGLAFALIGFAAALVA